MVYQSVDDDEIVVEFSRSDLQVDGPVDGAQYDEHERKPYPRVLVDGVSQRDGVRPQPLRPPAPQVPAPARRTRHRRRQLRRPHLGRRRREVFLDVVVVGGGEDCVELTMRGERAVVGRRSGSQRSIGGDGWRRGNAGRLYDSTEARLRTITADTV